jgi:uncharacterized protein (UPF0333 family)
MVEKVNKKDKKSQKTKFYFSLLTSYFLLKKGQTILEYTILLGVIVIVMSAMGPMLKRGIQSLIKVVADQVGVQQNAEQKFDETGHLEASYTSTRGSMDKQTLDFIGQTMYIFNDLTATQSNALINLGFTEEQ